MTLPRPPVPGEVDLKLYRRVDMPVELLNEPAFLDLPSNTARWAQARLVFECWRQEPAGSIPASRAIQAQLAGFGRDLDAWAKIEDVVIAHWELCSDGRYYFEPLVMAVLDAWGRTSKRRDGDKWRKRRDRLLSELVELGADVSSDDWRSDALGRLRLLLDDRDYNGHRGRRRREILITAASECGLLPALRGVSDMRLAASFRGGAARGPEPLSVRNCPRTDRTDSETPEIDLRKSTI